METNSNLRYALGTLVSSIHDLECHLSDGNIFGVFSVVLS